MGVEKVRDRNALLAAIVAAVEFFLSAQLGGSFHSRSCRLAEEPHESLDVLSHGCQEELLPHELQSAQAQAAQPDLILEFREQGFHLFSFPLCLRELWCVDQLASALASRLIHVNGDLYRPLVHCTFCEHAPQRLPLPI